MTDRGGEEPFRDGTGRAPGDGRPGRAPAPRSDRLRARAGDALQRRRRQAEAHPRAATPARTSGRTPGCRSSSTTTRTPTGARSGGRGPTEPRGCSTWPTPRPGRGGTAGRALPATAGRGAGGRDRRRALVGLVRSPSRLAGIGRPSDGRDCQLDGCPPVDGGPLAGKVRHDLGGDQRDVVEVVEVDHLQIGA